MALSRAEMEHRIAAQQRKQASSGGQRRPAPARPQSAPLPAAPAPTMQMQPMKTGGNPYSLSTIEPRIRDAMQRSAPINPQEGGTLAPPADFAKQGTPGMSPMSDKMLRMGPSGAPPPRDQLTYEGGPMDTSAMANVLSRGPSGPRRGLGNYGLGGDVGPGVHNTLLGFQKRRMGGY